jgi:hypothetical protein
MVGADAVISALGAAKGSVITDATRAVIAGAAGSGVGRFVTLSSFAVVRDRLSGPAKFMSNVAMGAMVQDKLTAEDLLRSNELDWTIVHAVRLTSGPATGRTKVLPESATLHIGDTISRADVAAWLIAAVADASTRHRAVAIAA